MDAEIGVHHGQNRRAGGRRLELVGRSRVIAVPQQSGLAGGGHHQLDLDRGPCSEVAEVPGHGPIRKSSAARGRGEARPLGQRILEDHAGERHLERVAGAQGIGDGIARQHKGRRSLLQQDVVHLEADIVIAARLQFVVAEIIPADPAQEDELIALGRFVGQVAVEGAHIVGLGLAAAIVETPLFVAQIIIYHLRILEFDQHAFPLLREGCILHREFPGGQDLDRRKVVACAQHGHIGGAGLNLGEPVVLGHLPGDPDLIALVYIQAVKTAGRVHGEAAPRAAGGVFDHEHGRPVDLSRRGGDDALHVDRFTQFRRCIAGRRVVDELDLADRRQGDDLRDRLGAVIAGVVDGRSGCQLGRVGQHGPGRNACIDM